MNKFTDFSDQVTFVSSQIIGRDFSEYHKFTDKSTKPPTTYWLTQKQWDQVKVLSSFKEKLDKVTSFNPPTGDKPPKKDNGKKPQDDEKKQKDQNPVNELSRAGKSLEDAKQFGKNSKEYKLAQKYYESVFNKANTNIDTGILEGEVANLKLDKLKSKLEKQKAIRDDGGIVRHAGVGLINTVVNSDAGAGLPEFHKTEWYTPVNVVRDKENHNKVDKAELLKSHPNAFYDKSKKIWVEKHDKDTITGYLSNNGDAFAKAAGKAVTTAAKTAGDTAMKMTGWEGYSDKTKYLRSRADAAKLMADDLGTSHAKKTATKAKMKADEAESQEKFGHIKKVTGTVSAGLDVAKTTLSSKARERAIRQEGVEGLEQKQAKLAYLLGDRSRKTKIALGKTEGMGPLAKIQAHAYQHKINKNREQYRQSLNAQYQPPQAYAPYYYPRAAGFSEEQVKALNGILSKDFSEGAEVFEGLNLSWQPEEYAKLNSILETDFETLDAQVSESQPDMSEKKVEENVSNEQVEDSQSGEIDVSDTIDYDNLDPETLTALVDKSYYEAPDEEKRYQEMIAKGFAEKESSYNNFLESMSDFVDQSL